MNRRNFIKNTSIAAVGATTISNSAFGMTNNSGKIRLGFIGCGLRAQTHLSAALDRTDCEVVACFEPQEWALNVTKRTISATGKPMPTFYTGDLNNYKKILERKDIDAVVICSPWQFHYIQAKDAMLAGKHVACEVIAAITIKEHWDLVKVSEQTKMSYMTLENVCYRRDLMAVLNIVRDQKFGELVHFEGGYQHDLRGVLFNDGKKFFGGKGVAANFGPYPKSISEAEWRTQWNLDRQGDIYPTHGAGPIMKFNNINNGNQFTNLVSFASKARGLAAFVAEVDPGNPNANLNYKNGDIITTLINCANGETVLLSHDTHLPRPYSLGFRVQGTKGIWMDVNKSIYIEGEAKNNDQWEEATSWLAKYDHPLWKRYENEAKNAGHGGMDFFVFNAFITALKENKPMPIDVYDSMTMSVITPLSEKSILDGNKPQKFPDFTNGKWKTRKNTFCLDNSGL